MAAWLSGNGSLAQFVKQVSSQHTGTTTSNEAQPHTNITTVNFAHPNESSIHENRPCDAAAIGFCQINDIRGNHRALNFHLD
ncbi:hypothetical protein E2P81_ATG02768 [Venturia nashicola]|uniref:Uncharacterized protein n=1 Tax=Venturia nashicola TaxID=86259 RepID=A0A4Z1PP94_9PEZI|nr:hypothetical protein E6O75_ATG02827 [Venturia nashicola]TLD36986.1 hypothetical protein E2P81_ATG02768 [Venturia nashicola]